MCKFWKKERCNHHFPELNRHNKICLLATKLFSWPRLATVSVTLTVVIGLIYFFQTNQTSIRGYKIKELENRAAQLQAANKKLILENVSLQSMANVVEKAPQLDLVAIDRVEVINAIGSTVALR